MSYSLENIYGSLPRTTRGLFTVLGADPKGKNFLYTNGNSVFIRDIESPFANCDVYTEHPQHVNVAKYSPSGFYIASADSAGKVRIWDTVNKEHILKNEFQPISGNIKDLQWSSDNQRIIIGGEGREKFGHVFNAETGTSTGEIMGTSKPINSVDFKPTRPFRAIVGSEDNSVCFFEGPPFKWKKTIEEHDRFVNVVRYSPDGNMFATGGADGKLVLFDGKTGEKINEINGTGAQGQAHSGSIYSISWDPTSKMILTASGDKSSRVWSVTENTMLKDFKFGNQVEDQQVGCLWQGNHLLSVSLSGNISYLNFNNDPDTDKLILKQIKGHGKSITALEVSYPNNSGLNSMMFSGSHDGLIIYWNCETGKMDQIQPGNVKQHTNQVQQLRFNPLANELISVGLDDTVKFIDLNEMKYAADWKLDSQPRGVDVSSVNGAVVVACISQLIVLTNRMVTQQIKISYEASCVSVSKNYVAVGGNDKKVYIYALDTMQEVATLDQRDFVTSVRFSHDNMYLAVADNAKNVKCYTVNSETGLPHFTEVTRDMWQHHAGRITNLSWSPDSKHLATSSVDTQCFIYSPSTVSTYIQIKNAHPLNPLSSCAWIDNNNLVTASQDCCLRKWKLTF